MDLALLEEKNLVNVWKQKGSYQRKTRNKNGFSGRKSKREETSLDLGSIFLTLITGLAKIEASKYYACWVCEEDIRIDDTFLKKNCKFCQKKGC